MAQRKPTFCFPSAPRPGRSAIASLAAAHQADLNLSLYVDHACRGRAWSAPLAQGRSKCPRPALRYGGCRSMPSTSWPTTKETSAYPCSRANRSRIAVRFLPPSRRHSSFHVDSGPPAAGPNHAGCRPTRHRQLHPRSCIACVKSGARTIKALAAACAPACGRVDVDTRGEALNAPGRAMIPPSP